MIRLEIGLEIRHRGVMSLCAIENKTAVVVVTSYCSVSRNPVRFKALYLNLREVTELMGGWSVPFWHQKSDFLHENHPKKLVYKISHFSLVVYRC